MRIVGGTLRGKTLLTPQTQNVRPTSDRLRETIFNILAHNPQMDRILDSTTHVLDTFAGSGALGLEALSRGCGQSTFVDLETSLVTQNVTNCGMKDRSHILRGDASTLPLQGPFQLVFLDPPYGQGLIEKTIENLMHHQAVADGAILVLEYHKEESITLTSELVFLTDRSVSISKVGFYKKN